MIFSFTDKIVSELMTLIYERSPSKHLALEAFPVRSSKVGWYVRQLDLQNDRRSPSSPSLLNVSYNWAFHN